MIRNDIPQLLEAIKAHKGYLSEVHKLIDIYNGNLKPYVLQVLQETLLDQSYNAAKDRVAPINTLQKLIDKLSTIYGTQPTREVVDGTEQDAALLVEYEKAFNINPNMNVANEMFNMNKACLVEPFLDRGAPKFKVIENDKFLVYSDNKADPTDVTHVVIFEGTQEFMTNSGYVSKAVFRAFTDDEFVLFDEDGNVLQGRMNEMNNPDGVNPYGKIPFVYINRSLTELVPTLDTDVCSLTILISLLLSDLGYAIKFQAFSIVYSIDVDTEGMPKAPNAIWQLRSDIEGAKPEVGTIKPDVDISEVMQYIMDLFALWMNSKGIKAGAVGENDKAISGFAKMIDEMDATEDKKKQAESFKDGESRLWELVMHYMHPYWVSTGELPTNAQFSGNAKVITSFHDIKPMFSRGQLVEELTNEVAAGFMSKRTAIKRLNPRLNDAEIDEMIKEIEADTRVSLPAIEAPSDGEE